MNVYPMLNNHQRQPVATGLRITTRHDPSAEKCDAAWLRLFGVDRQSEQIVDTFDGGDARWTLYASGRIHVYAYDGEAISVARVMEVLS